MPREMSALLPDKISPQATTRLLEKLSIQFGELKGMDPEHMILDNPVWTRPLMAVGNGSYYLPIPAMIQSFAREILERLLRDWHPDLLENYVQKVRPAFLERRTYEAIKAAFPSGKIYRNLTWADSAKGIEGENDVLVLLDTYALVFECKSGKLRPSARRGGISALRDGTNNLIASASEQGKGFADFLMGNRHEIRLLDKDKKTHELSLRSLTDAVTVNVHLEYIGPLGTMHRVLKEAGILKADSNPTASMALHDLEIVLQLLDRPAAAFHYLRRRAELESSNRLSAWELDLLAAYMAGSFDFGDVEGDEKTRLCLHGMATSLDPYLMGREIGKEHPMPKLKLTKWWDDCLVAFENRAFPGWINASHAMLSVSLERQRSFEEASERLRRSLKGRRDANANDTCIMVAGPPDRKTAIAVLWMWDEPFEKIREMAMARMTTIPADQAVNRHLVLVRSAMNLDTPYIAAYYWHDGMAEIPE
jgi:hypothetical protein